MSYEIVRTSPEELEFQSKNSLRSSILTGLISLALCLGLGYATYILWGDGLGPIPILLGLGALFSGGFSIAAFFLAYVKGDKPDVVIFRKDNYLDDKKTIRQYQEDRGLWILNDGISLKLFFHNTDQETIRVEADRRDEVKQLIAFLDLQRAEAYEVKNTKYTCYTASGETIPLKLKFFRVATSGGVTTVGTTGRSLKSGFVELSIPEGMVTYQAMIGKERVPLQEIEAFGFRLDEDYDRRKGALILGHVSLVTEGYYRRPNVVTVKLVREGNGIPQRIQLLKELSVSVGVLNAELSTQMDAEL